MNASHIKFDSEKLSWLNEPTKWNVFDQNGELEGSNGNYEILDGGNRLIITPPAVKDFWRRTYYTPTLIKSDASALVCDIAASEEATVCIDFEYTPASQFDQVIDSIKSMRYF